LAVVVLALAYGVLALTGTANAATNHAITLAGTTAVTGATTAVNSGDTVTFANQYPGSALGAVAIVVHIAGQNIPVAAGQTSAPVTITTTTGYTANTAALPGVVTDKGTITVNQPAPAPPQPANPPAGNPGGTVPGVTVPGGTAPGGTAPAGSVPNAPAGPAGSVPGATVLRFPAAGTAAGDPGVVPDSANSPLLAGLAPPGMMGRLDVPAPEVAPGLGTSGSAGGVQLPLPTTKGTTLSNRALGTPADGGSPWRTGLALLATLLLAGAGTVAARAYRTMRPRQLSAGSDPA